MPREPAGLELMPFAATIGVKLLVSADSSEVRARLAWNERLCTAGHALHGGAIMTLADSAGGLCAHLNLPDTAAGTTTIESKTNFLRAVNAGHVDAISRPIHLGRSVIVIETNIIDDHDRLVARVTQSQIVLTDPSSGQSGQSSALEN